MNTLQGVSGEHLGKLLVNVASVCVPADDQLIQHLEHDSKLLKQQLGQYRLISGDFLTESASKGYPTKTSLGHSIIVLVEQRLG